MDPAKAVANANSKVLRIEQFVEARHMDSRDQMAHIAAVVDQWRAETGGRSATPLGDRLGSPTVPAVGTPPRTTSGTCHCDGPPHPYSPGWCPAAGPVTR